MSLVQLNSKFRAPDGDCMNRIDFNRVLRDFPISRDVTERQQYLDPQFMVVVYMY